MLLTTTQILINNYGKQFINGTLTDEDLDTLYKDCFRAVGEKKPSDTPSDMAFTKMEAMLDFVIPIGSQMSEKQLLTLIPRLFAKDKEFVKKDFLRGETLAKYFLVMTISRFPQNEDYLLKRDLKNEDKLGDVKELYEKISEDIQKSLLPPGVSEEKYPQILSNFMKIIWPSKVSLLTHMVEDKANTLHIALERLKKLITENLDIPSKERNKAMREIKASSKNLAIIFNDIQQYKQTEILAAFTNLNTKGEMTAFYESFRELDSKLDIEFDKLRSDEKKHVCLSSASLESSRSSSVSVVETYTEGSRPTSSLSVPYPRANTSSIWSSLSSCFFKRPSSSDDTRSLLSKSVSPSLPPIISSGDTLTGQQVIRPIATKTTEETPRVSMV